MKRKGVEHFEAIATDFDDVWSFSQGYKQWMTQKIISLLDLNEDDILGDIGGGTGSFTHALACETSVKTAYCIEPSEAMCAQASVYEMLTPLCCEAHDPCIVSLGINKYLFKEVIHHIRDRQTLWEKLRNSPSTKRLLIVTRPQKIAFPLFQKALDIFASHQPHEEQLKDELLSTRWDISSFQERYSFELPFSQWEKMVRKRFMSDLGSLSDDEIEEGIKEIKARYEGERIILHDDIVFIVGTLP